MIKFIQVKEIHLFVILLILSSCASTKLSQQDRIHQEDWQQLYNEKNLFGWDIKFAGEDLNVNYKNTFLAKDSILRIQYNEYASFDEKYAHMYYYKPYSHYKLRFDYRFFGEQTKGGAAWNVRNSGVMVHSQSAKSNDYGQHFPVSIELQLLGGVEEGQKRTTGNMCSPGTNIVLDGKLDERHCISSTSETYYGDQWVSAEMVVLGSSVIHHIIEGDTVLSYTQPQIDNAFINENKKGNGWKDFGVYNNIWESRAGELLSSGYIALQAESHPIDFKNITLLDLKGCMDEQAKNYKSYFVEHDPDSCAYK